MAILFNLVGIDGLDGYNTFRFENEEDKKKIEPVLTILKTTVIKKKKFTLRVFIL